MIPLFDKNLKKKFCILRRILKIHEDLTNIIKSMENTKAADVSLANGMFVRKLTRLNESFLELTRKYYGNEIFNVHFENGGSTATDYINK